MNDIFPSEGQGGPNTDGRLPDEPKISDIADPYAEKPSYDPKGTLGKDQDQPLRTASENGASEVTTNPTDISDPAIPDEVALEQARRVLGDAQEESSTNIDTTKAEISVPKTDLVADALNMDSSFVASETNTQESQPTTDATKGTEPEVIIPAAEAPTVEVEDPTESNPVAETPKEAPEAEEQQPELVAETPVKEPQEVAEPVEETTPQAVAVETPVEEPIPSVDDIEDPQKRFEARKESAASVIQDMLEDLKAIDAEYQREEAAIQERYDVKMKEASALEAESKNHKKLSEEKGVQAYTVRTTAENERDKQKAAVSGKRAEVAEKTTRLTELEVA